MEATAYLELYRLHKRHKEEEEIDDLLNSCNAIRVQGELEHAWISDQAYILLAQQKNYG